MLRNFACALVASIALASASEQPRAQLLLPSRKLEPTSTFEVRFTPEMVPADAVGKPAVSPLLFEPAIEGKFVWLSARSGTFAPTRILPLGTQFKISLRADLKDAAGNPLGAKLNETAETPPMRVKGIFNTGTGDTDNASAVPAFLVLFNTNVNAAGAARSVGFVSSDRGRVEARVEQANDPRQTHGAFPAYRSDDHSLAVWGEPPAPPTPESTEGEEKPGPRRDNVLSIRPVKPLPPGADWRLVIDAGLPAADGKVRLPAPNETKIGAVQPFVVKSVAAETNHVAGRRIIIQFSKTLAPDLTAENYGRWITITPAPQNLKAQVEIDTVTLKGDFTLGVPYAVSAKTGIAAQEPFQLEADATKEVTFEKIPPRLYFEDFAVHQQAGGTRRFRLLSINVPRVRLTARLFTGDQVAAAVAAYDAYNQPLENAPLDESNSRIDPARLPGKMIWQHDLTVEADPTGDNQRTLPLNWDEILGANKTGAVLLTAESTEPMPPNGKRVGTQSIVQLTDIGAVWKRDRAQTFLHFFSLAKGTALPRIKLRLIDRERKQIVQTTADEHGDARVPTDADARWVFAQREGDAHLIAIQSGENQVPLYRLGVKEEGEDVAPADRHSVFLFTERGVYKPGETVHVKGYARNLGGVGPRVPAGKTITLTAIDGKEQEFASTEIKLSEFGSFNEEIKIPDGTLGKFRLVAKGDEQNELGGFCSFNVQQYKPNAFEITIPPPPSATGPGRLEFPLLAKYFMGKPLTKAKLTWTLVARDAGFTPEGLDDFVFCDGVQDFRLNRALDRISQFNEQGEAALDGNGAARVSVDLPLNKNAPQPRAAKLLCEITDINQQTVSESRELKRDSSDFYFGIRRFDGVLKEGDKLPIELIALRADGKPNDTSAPATVRLSRIEWQTNRLAGAGDTTEFESKAQIERVWEKPLVTTAGAGSDRKPLVAKLGDATAGKPGDYLLEVVGKDGHGNDVMTSVVFDVAGAAETSWNYQNEYAIDVVSDKESYAPGETATLMVKTPIAGDALVTVERDRVLRSFVTQLTGNAPSVQVPILDGDTPNVFVSVMMLRGSNESPRKVMAPEYRIGYCDLKVARPSDKLSVRITPSKPAFRPGDSTQLDADITDISGKPAANAEVTLYAVDEGVLSLTGYKTPDPLGFFGESSRLSVQTSLTLPTLLREDAAESDFANKGYLVGDGKGGSAIETLRTNFVACAFWNATLRTDARGHVHAEFLAPDSLTRYRVMAIAVTKESQFGASESAFEINKPLMIEPAMPQFGNVGDKLMLRGVVHNTTDFEGDAEVELKLDETARAAETTRRVHVPARGSVAIDFAAELVKAGHAKWSWSSTFASADQTQFRDAVQAELNVGYPTPLVREIHTARVDQDAGEIARIENPQILEGNGELEIALTNTRVLELRESLRQLLHYPYGCVEQATSSMLPWLTVRDLRATLPELAKTDEEVATAVNHGIKLLLSMQTSSGGLSYWPGGTEPMLWGSAYGGLGLALAQKAGYAIPEADAKRIYEYISAQLRGTSNDAPGAGLSDRCLSVYALAVAGRAEPAYHELLFRKRAQLSAEDRSLLALAILESKGPKSMVDELLKGPSVDDFYVEEWFGSVARENALALLAWTLHQPRAPRVDELATELFARRSNGHWTTTQGNAWSLLALSSYLRLSEQGEKNSAGNIAWAEKTAAFSLGKGKPSSITRLPLAPANAKEPVTLTKNGGVVFTEVTAAARPNVVEQPRQESGYSIKRRYAKIGDDGKLTAADQLTVGDRVLVTLDIDVQRRGTYLAVEDPLPSVLAPINPAFKSQEVLAGESLGTEWVSDYKELREDRAVFFSDLLYPGHYTLRYLARAVCAGDTIAAPAKIEEMYHPERFGTTATSHVSAKPLP